MRTIMVTGAGRGLGLELVKQHSNSKQGDTVYATNRSPSCVLEPIATRSGTVRLMEMDVSAWVLGRKRTLRQSE